jgi:hypothetical protein
MTSQQLMMNHLGVALASDSTVTLGNGGKTYSTVNKIFSLGGRQPVAFMVSSAANYIPAGVSWERVFGLYREFRGDKELPELVDYLHDFTKFILSQESLKIPAVNDVAIQTDLIDEFTRLVEPAYHKEKMQRATMGSYGGTEIWKETDLNQYLEVATAKRIEHILTQAREATNQRLEEKGADYANHIYKVKKIQSGNVKIAALEFCKRHECPEMIVKIEEIFLHHLCNWGQNFKWRTTSRIVITGFGKSELKPTMCYVDVGSDIIEGPFSNITRYFIRNRQNYSDDGRWIKEDSDDSTEYLWSALGFSQGFAQHDNMRAMMHGVLPRTNGNLRNYIPAEIMKRLTKQIPEMVSRIPGVGKAKMEHFDKMFDEEKEKILGSIKEVVEGEIDLEVNYRNSKFNSVTKSLPIDELARFVEKMVSLEVNMTHFLDDIRSVGGPIDVATVTKEDGFLWVQSKQSHDFSINPRQSKVGRDSANLI